MKSLFIILLVFILADLVTSQICSYYQEPSENEPHWKCNVPLKNVTSLFVTDIPKSKIIVLNREVLQPFEQLDYVHIGKCDIEAVASDTFVGRPLKFLHLNSNKIKKIEKGTLNSLNLTTSFEMTFNELEALEAQTFTGMARLSWMSLSANKISRIDKEAFSGLENLEALFLASNKISTLDPETFSPLRKLNLLDISYNQVTALQLGTFDRLPNLQKLILEQNELKVLPNRIFDKLTALSRLDIGRNKLSEIQNDLFGQVLENLFEFKIDNNKLKHFNASNFLKRAPRIKQIDLYDNPWNCDELEIVRKVLLKKNVFVPIIIRVTSKPNVNGIACEK